MRLFLVRYRIKDGGFSHGDLATSGGSYDTHHHVLVPALTKAGARALGERYAALVHGNVRMVFNKKVDDLGEVA